MEAVVNVDLEGVVPQQHHYDLRNRNAPQPQPQPPPFVEYGANKTRRRIRNEGVFARAWRWTRSHVAPTENDVFEKQQQTSVTKSVCRGTVATFCSIFIVAALVVVWDVATTPDNDLRRARTAQLLVRRDHVRIQDKLILDDGSVVYNVLNPQRAIDGTDEVAALMHKIHHHTPHGCVQPFSSTQIERGYAPYLFVSPHDLDADAVPVNFTLSALRDVMRAPRNSTLVCEGVLHYGIERNAIAVYDWGDGDNDDTLLFNPRIDQYEAEMEMRSKLIEMQSHCRIAEAVMGGGVDDDDEEQRGGSHVPRSASLEYVTNSGFKKRKRIHQPLVACIEHVLKLGGVLEQ